MSTNVEDQEIVLSAGDVRLRVSTYGASLRGLWREIPGAPAQEILTAYSGFKNKAGGQGDVMIPFPGRVREGRFTFGGQTHEMVKNDKESPAAIHGFLRFIPWDVAEQSDRSITLVVSMKEDQFVGYPFALRASITYTVTDTGMTSRFTVENLGESDAPAAVGFHPYFAVGSEHIDGDTLHVPMAATIEYDGLLPTGRLLPVEGTQFDFRTPRTIGDTRFNVCYLDPTRDTDDILRIRLTAPDGGRTVTVWMGAAFNYVVLYSGDPLPESHRRRSLAIEPMTCGSDALNHPQWGLVTLAPGKSFSGAWGVEG